MSGYGEWERTEVMSLRMPNARIRMLKEEANRVNVSTNALANQIIDGYFDFHLVASSAGMMPFPKKMLAQMINDIGCDDLDELCKTAAQSFTPTAVYMKSGKFTLEDFIEFLTISSRFAGFAYTDKFEGNVRTIMIRHGMGEKWSQLVKGSLEIIFASLDVRANYVTGDTMIVISIRTSR